MACPLCGDTCHCSFVPPRANAARADAVVSSSAPSLPTTLASSQDEEQFVAAVNNRSDLGRQHKISGIEQEMAEEQARDAQAERWRDEVADRINSYKTRKSRTRLSGEFSMRFDFEPPRHAATAAAPAYEPEPQVDFDDQPVTAAHEQFEAVAESAMSDPAVAEHWIPESAFAEPTLADPPLAEPVAPSIPARPERRRRNPGRLIEFPRLSFAGEALADELAEPVLDRPRILDVPESLVDPFEPSPLASLQLTEEEVQEAASAATPAPEFEIPPQVAPLPVRGVAAAIDLAVVVFGCLVFYAVAWKMMPAVPHTKMLLAAAVLPPLVFWVVYQYLFLVYGGITIGMQSMGLAIRGFNGEPTTVGARRTRVVGMALSCMSLGLGFFWSLADEDTLCWHDRISRTYVGIGN